MVSFFNILKYMKYCKFKKQGDIKITCSFIVNESGLGQTLDHLGMLVSDLYIENIDTSRSKGSRLHKSKGVNTKVFKKIDKYKRY